MTVENISWSISKKECCRPRWGLNPRPPGLQSRSDRRDERKGQGRKRNRNESGETEEIKTFPRYPYLLQGHQALPNYKLISVGRPGDVIYTTPSHHPTIPIINTFNALPDVSKHISTDTNHVHSVLWHLVWPTLFAIICTGIFRLNTVFKVAKTQMCGLVSIRSLLKIMEWVSYAMPLHK